MKIELIEKQTGESHGELEVQNRETFQMKDREVRELTNGEFLYKPVKRETDNN
jgi:hypothetical protein